MHDAAAADRPLGLLTSSFWIGLFSFREMIRRKRVFMVGLVLLLPVALVLAWRLLDTEGVVPARQLLAILSGVVYVHFLAAIVSLAVGISALGEPIDEGTIVYYWTRPLTRMAIYLGRLWAAQTVSAVLLAASMAVCFVVMVAGNFGVLTLDFLRAYLETCLVIILGAVVYTALFSMIGTALRKPMLPALIYAVLWESIGTGAPQKLQQLTVVFHLRNLIKAPESAPMTGDLPGMLMELKRALLHETPPPTWHSVLILAGVLAVSILLGVWFLRRKELFR